MILRSLGLTVLVLLALIAAPFVFAAAIVWTLADKGMGAAYRGLARMYRS